MGRLGWNQETDRKAPYCQSSTMEVQPMLKRVGKGLDYPIILKVFYNICMYNKFRVQMYKQIATNIP